MDSQYTPRINLEAIQAQFYDEARTLMEFDESGLIELHSTKSTFLFERLVERGLALSNKHNSCVYCLTIKGKQCQDAVSAGSLKAYVPFLTANHLIDNMPSGQA